MAEDILRAEADEFQGAILTSVWQHTAPYSIEVNGVPYTMFPDTFNPNYAKAARLLLDNLGVREGDTVLDPFTGSGVDAVFAARQGASRVVAVDKFEMPYLCTRYNVHRLGLQETIDVRKGNLWDVVGRGERFDLIVANPPFRGIEAHDDLESALRDPDYRTLQRFFRDAPAHLQPDGRMRVVFSDVGDMAYFHRLASEQQFSSRLVAKDTYGSSVRIHVYEIRRESGGIVSPGRVP